jgi:uncharacterized protein (TIGR02145 family)
VTKDEEWKDLRDPAYCWYNNDINNKDKYGALYNWFAIKTGKLPPEGRHVPSDSEWNVLEGYLIPEFHAFFIH